MGRSLKCSYWIASDTYPRRARPIERDCTTLSADQFAQCPCGCSTAGVGNAVFFGMYRNAVA